MPEALPDQLLKSVPVLMGVAVLIGLFLTFLWRLAGLWSAESKRRDDALERVIDRHERQEVAQFQQIADLGDAIRTKAAVSAQLVSAIHDLSRNVRAQTPTLDSLAHEVHAMSAPADDPLIGVPGGKFDPDITYSAKALESLADRKAWTHAAFRIPDLHAAGVLGKGAQVVVIDTGTDPTHPDLAPNTDTGRSKSYTGEPVMDGNGHGTHCSGIVAADNQGNGVLGIAPDATLVAVKGLSNQGSGRGDWLAAAIRYAADLPGHRILSMSFGSPQEDRQISDAIRYAYAKGHWLFAAAGNAGPNTTNWPGALDEVVCVAATGPDGKRAAFSSSNDFVDVGFGGVNVLSTIPNGRFAEYSGTSMACPGVAGVAALAVGELLKRNLPVPNQKVMCEVLYATCDNPNGRNDELGYGLVQPVAFVDALVRKVAGGTPTPPPPANPNPPGRPPLLRVAVPDGAKFVEFHAA